MARPHIAAWLEDGVRRPSNRRLRKRGWHERVSGYSGYGTPEKARVFGRVSLSKHEPGSSSPHPCEFPAEALRSERPEGVHEVVAQRNEHKGHQLYE